MMHVEAKRREAFRLAVQLLELEDATDADRAEIVLGALQLMTTIGLGVQALAFEEAFFREGPFNRGRG